MNWKKLLPCIYNNSIVPEINTTFNSIVPEINNNIDIGFIYNPTILIIDNSTLFLK
jgi:hypothetical protein